MIVNSLFIFTCIMYVNKESVAIIKGASEWSELLTVSLTNYADEIDRILKQVEAMLPNLKNTDIIQKAQDLLNSAINLMQKVSEGSVKDSFAARIQKAQGCY